MKHVFGLVAWLVVTTGCSVSATQQLPGGLDGGRLGDAGRGLDGGASIDSALPDPDAGPRVDTGRLPDVGSPDDAGSVDSGSPEACAVRADPGPCGAAIPRFTFDPQLGRCIQFVWGGCGDNPNNYVTAEGCVASCGGALQRCGGFAGAECGPSDFCDFLWDDCGGADDLGLCLPRPLGCPDIYDPVCGCDQITYANECDAHAAGVDVTARGPC